MVDLVNYLCGVSLDPEAMLDGAAALMSAMVPNKDWVPGHGLS